MATDYKDDKVFRGNCTFIGTVKYGATEAAAVSSKPPLQYVSQEILSADMTSGTTKTIDLVGISGLLIPEYCYVHTALEVASASMANTTGATVEVGTGGDPDALMAAISVFGAAAATSGARGVELGKLGTFAAGALKFKITATGPGTTNVTHISGLKIKVVIAYREVSATYPT